MDELMMEAEKHLERGEYEEARHIYEQIINDEPDNAKAYNKLGVIAAYEKNNEEAEAYFKKALELDPKLSSAASNLGNIFFEKEELEKARECYEKAIDLDPDNPIPYNNLAVIYKKQKEIDKFVKFYKKSVELSNKQLRNPQKDKSGKRQRATSSYTGTGILGFIAVALILYVLIRLFKG
ncbi:MAG TPA: tetratricopeptide repeat protein [Tepidanaerobacter syntrophicus]|uniref:tetratricopeptide repeat protein n=1 Tax=Tepidanaerobacter syntrophicus TaxID=224999 RepID=UPI00176E1036|nr:tetratricopeptide repeat protein [Tepidanaerobacter syntrophicus]